MSEYINLSDIFIKTHQELYKNKKRSNGKIKKHHIQNRYNELVRFVQNCAYWTCFNFNPVKHKYDDGRISGKYLNELHLFYVNHGFYDTLYKKLLDIYLKLTDYKTIEICSADSSFIRNIGSKHAKKNPHHGNKGGIKVNVLVDLYRTPISFHITDSNENDSTTVSTLMTDKFIDDALFMKHSTTFLADSSYSSFNNIYELTHKGLNVCMGRNSAHIKKFAIQKKATTSQIKLYKKRGIAENFFGNYQRRPVLLNNYEHQEESYRGLAVFQMIRMLAKKINNIAVLQNNSDAIRKHNDKLINDRKMIAKKKKERYAANKVMKEQAKKDAIKRRLDAQDKLDKLKELIWTKLSKNKITRQFNRVAKKVIKNNNKKDITGMTKKQKDTYNRKRNNLKCMYDKYIKDNMFNYIKDNILMDTRKYVFAKKELYIIIAKSYAFSDENIDAILKDHKIYDKIKQMSDGYILKKCRR